MKAITVEQLKERLDSGEKINLVDVREPSERAEYNIGGTHLPLGKITSMQADDLDALKNEEVVVYCRSGNRSGQACLFLEQQGFTNTVNVTGGMLAWKEKVDKS